MISAFKLSQPVTVLPNHLQRSIRSSVFGQLVPHPLPAPTVSRVLAGSNPSRTGSSDTSEDRTQPNFLPRTDTGNEAYGSCWRND